MSIEARLAALEGRVAQLEGRAVAAPPPPRGNAPPPSAVDADIDDPQYGDPKVRFDPRDWKGASHKGEAMSRCPPAFLRELASALEYFATKNDQNNALDAKGRPKSYWDRKDAAKARAWAARIEANGAPPLVDDYEGGDEGLPF
jgi:hypothetical protein